MYNINNQFWFEPLNKEINNGKEFSSCLDDKIYIKKTRDNFATEFDINSNIKQNFEFLNENLIQIKKIFLFNHLTIKNF